MKLPTGTDNLPKIAKRGEVTPIKKLIFSKITLQIQNRNPVWSVILLQKNWCFLQFYKRRRLWVTEVGVGEMLHRSKKMLEPTDIKQISKRKLT